MNIILLQRLHQVTGVTKPGTSHQEPTTVGTLTMMRCQDTRAVPFFSCITIENGGTSTAIANQDRRILPGTYSLVWQGTQVPLPNEHRGHGLQLINPEDPSFTHRRIFIHAGNYPQDTQGCILLQSSYDFTADRGYGAGSMRACKVFYDHLKRDGAACFRLIIRDEDAVTDPLHHPCSTL